MNAVPSMTNAAPRSMFEERPLRPPTIGKIRPGIKVLKSAAKNNPQAVSIYNERVAKGESFESIESAIENACKIKTPLVPKNVEYFTVRRSDFTNPDIADEIMRLYGEDRGEGTKLYKFPVVFVFNDWLENAPHQLTTWGQSGRKFFSVYEGGVRHCKAYAPTERDERANRAIRNFGPRREVHRQDEAIPDGVCNTNHCPEFQAGQCKLNASILFAIPEIKGLGLIELVTTSMYGIGKAREAMEMFAHANGRLSGNVLWISKKQIEISRQAPGGDYVRSPQWIPLINAEMDISKELANPSGNATPALRDARPDNVIDIADVKAAASDRVEGAADIEGVGPDTPFVAVTGPSQSAPLVSDAELGDEAAGEPEGTPTDNVKTTTPAQSAVPAGHDPKLGVDPASAADSSVEMETIEEKRNRLSSLLQTLEITTKERQALFRRYANLKFGGGWTRFAKELDSMNNRLIEATANRPAFEEEMERAVAELKQFV